MLALVNDILEVARLEAGAVDLDLRAERVADVFSAAVRAAAGQAEGRGVTFTCDVQPSDLAARADGRALHDALRRVLDNAVAFSPEGAQVRLSARRSGKVVRIAVEDDGPGVARSDVHRLLRPFQQGDLSRSRGVHGAGLGLAVANLLCKAMGGRLRLVASEGRGLTACIRLPLAAPHVEASAPTS